ncbi:MAG: hypothetical protein GTN80_09880, partial [Nitrososphaeria archaeon]|nr:hypothetical protein [Nitrososphaeria archaeon]
RINKKNNVIKPVKTIKAPCRIIFDLDILPRNRPKEKRVAMLNIIANIKALSRGTNPYSERRNGDNVMKAVKM